MVRFGQYRIGGSKVQSKNSASEDKVRSHRYFCQVDLSFPCTDSMLKFCILKKQGFFTFNYIFICLVVIFYCIVWKMNILITKFDSIKTVQSKTTSQPINSFL
jgi:hypothetical protein